MCLTVTLTFMGFVRPAFASLAAVAGVIGRFFLACDVTK